MQIHTDGHGFLSVSGQGALARSAQDDKQSETGILALWQSPVAGGRWVALRTGWMTTGVGLILSLFGSCARLFVILSETPPTAGCSRRISALGWPPVESLRLRPAFALPFDFAQGKRDKPPGWTVSVFGKVRERVLSTPSGRIALQLGRAGFQPRHRSKCLRGVLTPDILRA